MRIPSLFPALLMTLAAIPLVANQGGGSNAFLGPWNLTGSGPDGELNVFWLEIKDENGKPAGMLLNRGGSPVPLGGVTIVGDELVVHLPARANRPALEARLKRAGETLTGTVSEQGQTIAVVGTRPPTWSPADANATHTFEEPVNLFDGQLLDAWMFQHKNQPSGWSVVDGVMTNEAGANNLVSKQKFQDFRIQAEYKLAEESNSGIYLRGRYELQVLDDHGKPPGKQGHMAIYSRTAPAVNASKPAGEWQTMEAVIVGNRVTVVLNGQKVHDNAEIPAITGGALDANELEPGPILLQGDHGKVWFRKVVVTPIRRSGR
ncbi:MAG: DUF1080 domain-containing protein [Acidobacteria bacterium]|nr:DUF1080 domain-containing protein [Acidobacteriota bacterium]